jgi:hypothetical protein
VPTPAWFDWAQEVVIRVLDILSLIATQPLPMPVVLRATPEHRHAERQAHCLAAPRRYGHNPRRSDRVGAIR